MAQASKTHTECAVSPTCILSSSPHPHCVTASRHRRTSERPPVVNARVDRDVESQLNGVLVGRNVTMRGSVPQTDRCIKR